MYLYEQLIRDASTTSTVRELGAAIGVPATTINDWLVLNKKPHLKSLEKVAVWADLPLSTMLADIQHPDDLKIIELIQQLTPDQKLQIVLQMRYLIAHPAPLNVKSE